MLKKYLKFNLIFALIFILQLVAEYYELSALKYITKPLIVISLLIMFAISTKLKGRFHKRLFTGLVFGLIGDVLLMLVWKNEAFLPTD
ncbi:lysoplasmalogenase family protein [Pedobacter panaciterrae]